MKKVAIKMPAKNTADAWISKGREQTAGKPATTKLTLLLPVELHRRMKVRCAERGELMADVIRSFLEREFPER